MTEGHSVETGADGLSRIEQKFPFAQVFDVNSEIPELPDAIGSHSLPELAKETGAHVIEEMVAMFPQRLQSLAPLNELNPLFNKGVELW
jgi:hypothetical protein